MHQTVCANGVYTGVEEESVWISVRGVFGDTIEIIFFDPVTLFENSVAEFACYCV